MLNLNQIPLARLVLPFIIGIAAAVYFSVELPVQLFWSAILILFTALVFIQKLNVAKAWFGVCIMLFLMLCGIEFTNQYKASNKPYYFANNDNAEVVVRIAELPQPKEKSVKAMLQVVAVRQGNQWAEATGNILGYFSIDSTANALKYGDELLLACDLNPIPPPQNPGQFNYKNYLANKGVYHQCYIKPEHYILLNSNSANPIYNRAYSVRSYLLQQLKNYGLEGQQLAVASALLLGYDDEIDNDLLSAYSASGTIHILSVSGMHAGLVYIAIMWLLGFMGQSSTARVVRVVTVITLLWLYALITGFSPPVIRAAAMFSFLALGQSLNRYINSINILAGSCLLMLLANPFLLADVGFQLSYIAVFGMVTLYQPIYNWYEPKWYIVDKAWQFTAASIAAQLVTFPLSLLYFHQFPNLFVFSNLLIIPMSTVAIFMGIALLMFSFIPSIAAGLGYLLNMLIGWLNDLVLFESALPYAVAKYINISTIEMAVVYIVLIILVVAIWLKRKALLFAGIGLLVLFFGYRIYHHTQILNQHKLVVYNLNKGTALEFIDGDESVLVTDSLAMPGTKNFAFSIDAGQWYFGLSKRNAVILNKPLLQWGNVSVGINTTAVEADYLLIANNLRIDFANVKNAKLKHVIFLPNNKPKRIKEWQEQLTRQNVSYYNMGKQGAFIVDL